MCGIGSPEAAWLVPDVETLFQDISKSFGVEWRFSTRRRKVQFNEFFSIL